MKTIWIIPIIALFWGCKSQKTNTITAPEKSMVSTISACPQDGKCSLEIFRNKRLNVLSDQYGSVYYQMLDDDNSSVIQYFYDRNVPKDLQDANYREEIVFEVKNTETNLSLSDNELQKTKMLFGRFCFCRGETGYYKVDNGSLNLNQKENNIDFNLQFTIDKVPQIIKTIQGNLK